jgi:hypothetical protein
VELTRKTLIRTALGILGAIVVGAIGSGVWQGILGPILRVIGIWILDTISLFFNSFKNDIYIEIAQDNAGGSLKEILTLVSFTFLGAWILFVTFMSLQLHKMKVEQEGLSNRLNAVMEGTQSVQPTAEQVRLNLENSARDLKQLSLHLLGIKCCTVVLTTLILVSVAKIGYMSSAQVYYHQILKIASPHMTTDELRSVEAKFAQITNRQGYVEVADRLTTIAKTNGETVPRFKPW